ncbi:MAG TPA: MOSC N-terminal beta barrel domain-containing protein [Candidatus Didemnitutus sp.]|jgi:hypothetical protein
MPAVVSLHIYPVKSCRGLDVATAEVDSLGFVGDRRFMAVTPEGGFLTQRTVPAMARIATRVQPAGVSLSAEGFGSIEVPFTANAGSRRVVVWRDSVDADDCGDEPADWLSAVLGAPTRLVHIGRDYHRPIRPSKARPGDVFSFADGYPFLVISEESLQRLNDRIAERGHDGVPMNRFRPNIVISGVDAFSEDAWARVRIGAVTFRTGGPCARCVITTTDQFTGTRGKEPLATLATFRRDPNEPTDVNFGMNLIHEIKSGAIHVGDDIEVLG